MKLFSSFVVFAQNTVRSINSMFSQDTTLLISRAGARSARARRLVLKQRFDFLYRIVAAVTIFGMVYGPIAPVTVVFAEEIAEMVAPAPEPAPAPVVENPSADAPASETATTSEGAPLENITDNANLLVIPNETTQSNPASSDAGAAETEATATETEVSGTASEGPTTESSDAPDAQAPPEGESTEIPTDVPAGATVESELVEEAPTEEVKELTEEEKLANEKEEADKKAAEDKAKEAALSAEDTIIDAELDTTPETVVHGNLVKVKIADFNIEGKEDGDLLTDEEAVATILSLTTKRKELIAETPTTTTGVVVDAASSIIDAITGDDSIDVSDYANLATAEEKIEAIAEDIIEDKNLDDVITYRGTSTKRNSY